jgi:hypothetical protein
VICDQLPDTGLSATVGLLVLVATTCLIAGATLVLLSRRSRGGPAALALLLLLGTATTMITLATATPAEAAAPGCSSTSPSSSSSSVRRLTVTQTSTMAGLAPGVAPAPITGRLVNHGAGSTRITAVDVEIAYVTPRPNSSAGACRASDYKLIAARMPVGRTLAPGGSTKFAGASIGFDNKLTNQDGCKRANVHLRYAANPSGTLVPHRGTGHSPASLLSGHAW